MEKFLSKKEALYICERKGFIVMEITDDHIKFLDRRMNSCRILIAKEDEEEEQCYLPNNKWRQ